jgi:transposase-like protein
MHRSTAHRAERALLDEIVREGARWMPAAALEAEVNAHIGELTDERSDKGCRLVVRNGYHQPRRVTTADAQRWRRRRRHHERPNAVT